MTNYVDRYQDRKPESLVLKKSRSKSKLLHQIRVNWILYLFVLPVIAYYIIFHYIPIYGVQIAFQDYKVGDAFGMSPWIGFKHFTRFFESYWFPAVMKNTLVISLLSFAFFPCPILLALMLNEITHTRYKKLVQTVTYAPHFISMVVLCGAVTLFLSPSNGLVGILINEIRSLWGLKSINLLTNGPAFKWIYVISGVWQETGWASVIYFAALSGVDPGLLEAAEIDGANKLKRMWYINLPVLVPTIVIMLILRCGSIISVGFEKTYLLQNSATLAFSEVISTYVYRAGMQGAQYSFASAVGLFNSIINAAMLILANGITRALDRNSSLW